MADVVSDSGNSSSEKKKRKFPDGTNISQYNKYKTWTYRRWAWEFLSRNHEFIKACDKVANGTELEKSKVAKEFGLVKFKHYSDRWTRENVFPTFKDGAIKCFPNLGKESIKKGIRVASGQVLIRFKLASDIDVFAAIKAQVQRAELRLIKLHTEFNKGRAMKNPIENDGKEPDASLLIKYLRILDLKANEKYKNEEIVKYIHEDDPNRLDVYLESWMRDISRKIPEANKYPNRLYRYLALRLGKPSPGK